MSNEAPDLLGIDHVHVYVRDRDRAEAWYADVLGCTRMPAYASCAEDPDGPVMLQCGPARLALFASTKGPTDVVACGTDAAAFLAWLEHLRTHGLELRIVDHEMAFSVYFSDLDGNSHEITCYDVESLRGRVATGAHG